MSNSLIIIIISIIGLIILLSIINNYRKEKLNYKISNRLINKIKNNESFSPEVEFGHMDVNCTGESLYTPLMWACYKGNINIVRFLMNKGANPNLYGKGENALTLAIYQVGMACLGGYVTLEDRIIYMEIIELLLNYGANPDKTMGLSQPPLILACSTGDRDLVKLLIKYYVNPYVSIDNKTPEMVARDKGHSGTARLIERYKKDFSPLPPGIPMRMRKDFFNN